MQEILKLQKKIVPELVELLEKRYSILRTIYYNQPIGRRVLATDLGIGERIVRTEINFLKNQNLIEINTPGMTVTDEGEEVLENLKSFIHEIKGLSDVEKKIKKLLDVKDVIVVPGSVDYDETIMMEIGKAAALYTRKIIKHDDIIAVTGGSTVKEFVDNFPKVHNLQNILVVPARGGMGKKVETQANTLAASLAKKLGGSYRMLHIPENLSEEIIEKITTQKDIKDVIDLIHKANVLIYGIGRADRMAFKRGVPVEQVEQLLSLGAVGEAFGCYFNETSQVVSVIPTLGINIDDIKKIRTHIAVAGGKDKVDAIIATLYKNQNGVIITDEVTAKEILNKFNKSLIKAIENE